MVTQNKCTRKIIQISSKFKYQWSALSFMRVKWSLPRMGLEPTPYKKMDLQFSVGYLNHSFIRLLELLCHLSLGFQTQCTVIHIFFHTIHLSLAGYRLPISYTKCNTVSINSFLARVFRSPSTKSDLKTLLNGASDSYSFHNINYIEKPIQFRITPGSV